MTVPRPPQRVVTQLRSMRWRPAFSRKKPFGDGTPTSQVKVDRASGMAREVTFSVIKPGCDRVHHITPEDVRIVLGRSPDEVWHRLRAVHFNDRSVGARRLGYVNRGHREIALCALPPRVSLARFLVRGQSPDQFGAIRGCQWPGLAIRRFLLYDVFLHELGHLQVVDPQAKTLRRIFAGETLAEEFATCWRKRLWSEPFDHPDPAHNPPARGERVAASQGAETEMRS